jgi:molybdopterin molybdotransferase
MGPKEFIPVAEARSIIAGQAKTLPTVILPIEKTLGLTLAQDIYSPLDIPAFDQSSVDGYAISIGDISDSLPLQGAVQAGSSQRVQLLKKHAMRIFTGAPLPLGADTIVMQEKVSAGLTHIKIENGQFEKGTFVRPSGSEIKKGELVLQKGACLSATLIGLLASIGIPRVSIYPSPVITIIATGKELQNPGNALNFGQVYESNVYFLSAALQQALVSEIRVLYAEDELTVVQQRLALALENSDLVLLTGGVSVGDYDFVRKAADINGIECQFHKVRQKPGKPFYFGTKGNQLIFGLPGNPASVITCFYEYVLPAIGLMMQGSGATQIGVAVLKEGFRKVEGLTQFLKARVENGIVAILAAQESYRLRSFSQANCLVCLDEERLQYEKGEQVTIRRLPV